LKRRGGIRNRAKKTAGEASAPKHLANTTREAVFKPKSSKNKKNLFNL
jgi:hypothetical protein